jgi:hypothetical protein
MNGYNHLLNRRCFACGLIVATTAPIFGTLARASGSPFCEYSVDGGWGGASRREYITREARPNDPSNIPQVVSRIMDALSFNADFDVFLAEHENNAFATVARGRKILVVDVGFVDRLNRIVGTQWAAISVIAHEIGHHIAGFSGDRHRCELNADYWSGQSLQRLGSARDSAMRAILLVGSDQDTPTHPNKRRRIQIIARGWDDASQGRIDYSFCDACRG